MNHPSNFAIGKGVLSMENFKLTLLSSAPAQEIKPSAICGVVSSGNLEILVESTSTKDACTVVVNTSAHGFRDIWEAVLNDFARRHSAGGFNFTINDAGATPAVVSLRLDQAFEICSGDTK
jgi:malonate decarboxylase delta subunit